MTLTIELTPEEERRIREAEAKGIDVTALFKGILAGLSDGKDASSPRRSALDIINAYHGPRRTTEEINRYIEEERNSWDR